MLESKGKKSKFKSELTFIAMGVALIVALLGGLYIWYVAYPAFKDLILCLSIVGVLVIVYFAILRGVFLNKNAGYLIEEELLTIKDGFPNSKKHVIKISQISSWVVKKYNWAYLVVALCVFVIGTATAIVLGILLKLGVLIPLAIIFAVLLVCAYFIALHFLSRGLVTIKVHHSEKRVSLKNVTDSVAQQIVEKLKQKVSV